MSKVTMRATLQSADGVEKTKADGVGVLALIEQEDGSTEFRMLGKIDPLLALASCVQLVGRSFDRAGDDSTRMHIRMALEVVHEDIGEMRRTMAERLGDYEAGILAELERAGG